MSAPSSPFVESPGRLGYELRAAAADKQLAQSAHQSLVAHYERLLDDKNTALHRLQDDFDFVYKDRADLRSQLDNTRQTSEQRIGDLQAQNKVLLGEVSQAQAASAAEKSTVARLTAQLSDATARADLSAAECAQLRDQTAVVQRDNRSLISTNDELVAKLEAYASSLASDTTLKLTESLAAKNAALNKANAQLHQRLDKLLQERTSAELLRQKNLSLATKLAHLQEVQESHAQLEIDHAKLQARFDSFFKIISVSTGKDLDEEGLVSFLGDYTHLQSQLEVLQHKFNETQSLNNDLKAENVQLQYRIDTEFGAKIESLQQTVAEKDVSIEKLGRQVGLSAKEVAFLRQSLKKFERINQKDVISKSTDEYLSNLEKLVDDYKKEIASLQNQLNSAASRGPPAKRPKLDDEYRRRSEIENKSLQSENIELLSTVKDLNNRISVLQSNLDQLNQIDQKTQDLTILQLKSNPLAKDQLIKQSVLDSLRKENESLIEKYVKNLDAQDQVPKSLFERQETDKAHLSTEIQDLHKRNKRLKQNFTKKAKDILSTISSFFGFSIEFLESSINPNELSSKIKLTSKLTANNDSLKNSYIILDLTSKSLKAYGNYEFKTLCEDLIAEWSNDKDQVACILSALNISLYKKFVLS